MQKPIIIDSEWVRPFDVGGEEKQCAMCSTEVARWVIGKPPNSYFNCARCFLYTSPWGKENEARLKEFVSLVEEAINKPISEDGVVLPGEADRILSSIVSVSGIARARSQRRLRDEGTGT